MQSLMYGNLYLLHCHSYSICWIENPTTFTQYQYQCLIMFCLFKKYCIKYMEANLAFYILKNVYTEHMYTRNTKNKVYNHWPHSGYRGCIYLDSRVVTSSWFDTILNFTYNQTDKKRQHSSVLIAIFLQYIYIYIGKNIVNKAYTIMQWH